MARNFNPLVRNTNNQVNPRFITLLYSLITSYHLRERTYTHHTYLR